MWVGLAGVVDVGVIITTESSCLSVPVSLSIVLVYVACTHTLYRYNEVQVLRYQTEKLNVRYALDVQC